MYSRSSSAAPQASERDAVYVVGRSDAAQHLHLRCRTKQRAEAEARQSVRLGKCPADEEIVDRAKLIEQALAAKMNVGFVDQHGGLRRGAHNRQQLLACGDGPGGIVGIGNADQTSLRGDRTQQVAGRKIQRLAGLHGANHRAGRQRIDLIHAERGHGDQRLVSRLKIGLREQMNRLIHAIGQQHLLRGYAEMASQPPVRRARAQDICSASRR